MAGSISANRGRSAAGPGGRTGRVRDPAGGGGRAVPGAHILESFFLCLIDLAGLRVMNGKKLREETSLVNHTKGHLAAP